MCTFISHPVFPGSHVKSLPFPNPSTTFTKKRNQANEETAYRNIHCPLDRALWMLDLLIQGQGIYSDPYPDRSILLPDLCRCQLLCTALLCHSPSAESKEVPGLCLLPACFDRS